MSYYTTVTLIGIPEISHYTTDTGSFRDNNNATETHGNPRDEPLHHRNTCTHL